MMVEDYYEERITDEVVLCSCIVDGEYREYKKYLPIEKGDKSANRTSSTQKKNASPGNNGSGSPISRDRENVVFENEETYVPDLDDDLDR